MLSFPQFWSDVAGYELVLTLSASKKYAKAQFNPMILYSYRNTDKHADTFVKTIFSGSGVFKT